MSIYIQESSDTLIESNKCRHVR